LSYISSTFCSGYFGDGISWIICLGWPWLWSSQIASLWHWHFKQPSYLKRKRYLLLPLIVVLGISPL
jgi:hypothetical protein